jgi:hypothetical protein
MAQVESPANDVDPYDEDLQSLETDFWPSCLGKTQPIELPKVSAETGRNSVQGSFRLLFLADILNIVQ